MQGLQIKPYPNNAKEHTDEQIELIAKSIERFGFQQPIKVNGEGYIIVGHGRWEAYQRFKTLYKLEEPWIIGEEGKLISGKPSPKKLTPQEEAAYRLADNEINALTGNNMRMVKEELIMIADPELQMLTGHDLDILIEEDEADNAVPSVPETPKSKLGDLYKLGNHFLLCGDSTKHEDVHKLVQLAKMDCVVTDPPYNVNYKGIGENTSQGIMNDNMEESAFDDFLHDTFQRMAETVKEGPGRLRGIPRSEHRERTAVLAREHARLLLDPGAQHLATPNAPEGAQGEGREGPPVDQERHASDAEERIQQSLRAGSVRHPGQAIYKHQHQEPERGAQQGDRLRQPNPGRRVGVPEPVDRQERPQGCVRLPIPEAGDAHRETAEAMHGARPQRDGPLRGIRLNHHRVRTTEAKGIRDGEGPGHGRRDDPTLGGVDE